MLRIILIIIVLSCFLPAGAQKKIAFILVKGGISFPMGDFGNTGKSIENGYAEKGNILSFDGGYYIVDKAGVFLSYSSAKYPFDDTQLGFDYGISAQVNDYFTSFLGVGLFYEYDFRKNYSIMTRLCFGWHKARFPAQYYESEENTLDVPSNTQKGISVPLALDFKYFFLPYLGVMISVEYQVANHTHSWGVGGYYPVAATWDISYQTINLDFGLVFKL